MSDAEALIAAIEEAVESVYREHADACPARMRDTCTCDAWPYNGAIVQTMHRVRGAVRAHAQRTPAVDSAAADVHVLERQFTRDQEPLRDARSDAP